MSAKQNGRILASINCGWENESFYAKNPAFTAADARGIVQGVLDPLNIQTGESEALLDMFQRFVWNEPYRERMRRHHELFRAELERRLQGQPKAVSNAKSDSIAPPAKAPSDRIPADKRERFAQVSALIEDFGTKHLDAELTGFCIELWKRICRRKAPDCRLGKATIWAASVIHVIARINFLSDRNQPVHLTFDTICGFFDASKATIGMKATQIERDLRLRQHTEPGLCRRSILEQSTFLRRSSGGMSISFNMAKEMGYIPPDARVEDFL